MNNMLVLLMILPMLAGVLLVFLRPFVLAQRIISLITMFGTFILSVYLLLVVQNEGIMSIDFGGWFAPIGISFVGDAFSLLLVVTTNLVVMICLLYIFASIGKEKEKMYVYPFIHLLVAGVNGSFLTGDLFNLFVCFEVMLLASYALLVLGGKQIQLREAVKYVLVNVISSALFLIAIAYLYGALGTLNMAHLSVRIAEVNQPAILTTIAIVFLLVFSLKAGLLLYFWLPGTYGAPPMAIAALFGSLLTKVGIYALFRTFTLLFYHQVEVTHVLIAFMAMATMIGGSLGAISSHDVRKVISYNVVIAVGFILSGLAVYNTTAIEGAIYYLIHDMITKALLFLLIGVTMYASRTAYMERMSGLIYHYPLLGWLFFLVMLALAGIPPLSGFIGKIYVAQGVLEGGAYVLLIVGLIASMFVLYSLLRVFTNCFWGEPSISEDDRVVLKKG